MPKVFASVLTVLTLLCVFSCAPTRYPNRANGDTAQLEKKLAETNQKLDQLYHQVSILQLMVDSQQRGKMDLKGSGSRPPAGISEESISDTATPAPIGEKKPISPAMESPPAASITSIDKRPEPVEKQPEPAALKNSPEAKTLYDKAYSLYKDHKYQEASELFDTLSARYPNHDLADNALYWAGECRYATKDYAGALRSLMTAIKNYPNGNKMPDVLYKAGLSYLALGDKDNGVDYLKKVIKNFPFSAIAPKAEERLKQLNIQ
jgi:tol-pal system protein YbgF